MANKKQTLKIAKYFFNFPKVAEFGHAVYERVEGRKEGRKEGSAVSQTGTCLKKRTHHLITVKWTHFFNPKLCSTLYGTFCHICLAKKI